MQRCIPSDVVIRVCAIDYSTSLTARDFTREGSVKTRSSRAAIAALAVPAVLLFAGCTSSAAGPSDSSSASSAPTSAGATTSPPSSSSPPMSPSASVTSSSAASTGTPTPANPWPSDLTPDQATAAAAAITAYTGLWRIVDQAFAAPGQDWSTAVAGYATASAQTSLLEGVMQTAARGQRRVGSTNIAPQVTSVDLGLVTIRDCVDSTGVDILNSAGDAITAPDAPGSYRRHVSTAHVGQVQTGQWLVSDTVEDWSAKC